MPDVIAKCEICKMPTKLGTVGMAMYKSHFMSLEKTKFKFRCTKCIAAEKALGVDTAFTRAAEKEAKGAVIQ